MTCDLSTSLRITEWTYGQVELVGGLTWEKGHTMVPLPLNWHDQLGALMIAGRRDSFRA